MILYHFNFGAFLVPEFSDPCFSFFYDVNPTLQLEEFVFQTRENKGEG